jgi:uncharacterized protein YyaL (SSP411 family)
MNTRRETEAARDVRRILADVPADCVAFVVFETAKAKAEELRVAIEARLRRLDRERTEALRDLATLSKWDGLAVEAGRACAVAASRRACERIREADRKLLSGSDEPGSRAAR